VVRDVDAAIGNGYLWRRAALERVGLLDETLFGYHEDIDWCERARRDGWRVVYAGTAAIVHRGGSSSRPEHARVFPARYFLGRNAVRFTRRYGGAAQRLRFAALCGGAVAARLARAVLRGDRAGIAQERDYARGHLGRSARPARAVCRARAAGRGIVLKCGSVLPLWGRRDGVQDSPPAHPKAGASSRTPKLGCLSAAFSVRIPEF
jgi:hypothetical protein